MYIPPNAIGLVEEAIEKSRALIERCRPLIELNAAKNISPALISDLSEGIYLHGRYLAILTMRWFGIDPFSDIDAFPVDLPGDRAFHLVDTTDNRTVAVEEAPSELFVINECYQRIWRDHKEDFPDLRASFTVCQEVLVQLTLLREQLVAKSESDAISTNDLRHSVVERAPNIFTENASADAAISVQGGSKELPVLVIHGISRQVFLNGKEVPLKPTKVKRFDALLFLLNRQLTTHKPVASHLITDEAGKGTKRRVYDLFKNTPIGSLLESTSHGFYRLKVDPLKSKVHSS